MLHVNPFVVHPNYRPGPKTLHGQEVSEWQVVLTVIPADPTLYQEQEHLDDRLRALRERHAVINLSLPLKRYDG